MFGVMCYSMISKTESGRVSKEIPGSRSGLGARCALDTDEMKISLSQLKYERGRLEFAQIFPKKYLLY